MSVSEKLEESTFVFTAGMLYLLDMFFFMAVRSTVSSRVLFRVFFSVQINLLQSSIVKCSHAFFNTHQ